MTFFWPNMLWLLAIVPALVAAYLLVLRRKRAAAQRYASLSIAADAGGTRRRRWSLFDARLAPFVFLLPFMSVFLVFRVWPVVQVLEMTGMLELLPMDNGR